MQISKLFLRRFFCWYFATLSMICIALVFGENREYVFRSILSVIVRRSAFLVLAITFGAASWITWRERASACLRGRGWIIAACLLNLLISAGVPLVLCGELLYYRGHITGVVLGYLGSIFAIPTIIGAIGLVAFARS
jgi:hypothetical protein